MFWPYIRLFRNLSVLQHVVVFLTTFMIPVSFELEQGWQDAGICLSCVNWGKLALYFGWYQIAMLVIALATRRDRARVEERLDRMFSELTDSVSQLSEEHQRQMTGIEDRVRDLQGWVQDIRSALCNELGVDLPPLAVSARGVSFHFEVPPASGTVTAGRAEGWRPYLLRWIKRQARNLRRWARRIFVDWEEH